MNPPSDVTTQGGRTWFKWILRWLFRGILSLIVLIILFYVEEDWRGARAWASAQDEIKAQGISLVPNAYIPPSIPDAENFGALPIFQGATVFDLTTPLRQQSNELTKALQDISSHIPASKEQSSSPDHLPYLGSWQKGESPDVPAIRKQLEEFGHHQNPEIQIPLEATAPDIFKLLCPALADLREKNVSHQLCRFDRAYGDPLMSLTPLTSQITLAKVLSYEESLALCDNESQLAIDDLNVEWKVVSGLQKEPFLVSGLVAAGVVSIQMAVVQNGLAQHVWNDQQLANLDAALGKMDFLGETLLCLRGDFVVSTIPWLTRAKTDRLSLFRQAHKAQLANSEQKPTWLNSLLLLGDVWLPSNGYFDLRLAEMARSVVLGSLGEVDPASRRVFPEKVNHELDVSSQSQSVLHAINKFAFSQVQVDEARIACRLERYRLAHGSYPDSLEALVPAYGPELPHDVMNGEPYHYKLNGDGTYMLYSVGWDQKDDGGQLGAKTPFHNSDNLDWVWTNYPDQQKAK